jgi:hypothetical protein
MMMLEIVEFLFWARSLSTASGDKWACILIGLGELKPVYADQFNEK